MGAMNKISDLSLDFVDATISAACDLALGLATHLPEDSDATSVYFVGRTLCIDIKDDLGNRDVLTISYQSEDIGFFSGERRRLLPIKTLRLLESLMTLCAIKHDKKEYL
jgi:hypothetical protein